MNTLLIVCLTNHVRQIERAIQIFAHPGATAYIHVLGVQLRSGERASQINRLILSEAVQFTNSRRTVRSSLLIESGINAKSAALQEFFHDVQKWPLKKLSNTANSRGSIMPPLLRYLQNCGLSVVTFAERLVSYWMHASVTSLKMDTWLGQFDQIGCAWLGERLLRFLEVVNSPQLSEDLFESAEMHPTDIYCVLSDPQVAGKSASVISNLFRKHFPTWQLSADPTVSIESTTRPLHIFEDGLFTGTEVIGVFESLLNERARLGKRNKVRPLSNPNLLRETPIILHFARACDYGEVILSSYLTFRELNNITITVPTHGKISVLSDEGKAVLQRTTDLNSIWEEGPPPQACIPYILRNPKFWGTISDFSRATKILDELGSQLFQRYLERKRKSAGWQMWPEQKLKKCSMGMWGCGLLLAFSHSVPKASVPVLWSGGHVNIAGRQIYWHPLFDKAA